MRVEIRKAVIDGRNKYDQAIYPLGSWTVWKDGHFVGWNWQWQCLWDFVFVQRSSNLGKTRNC